MGDALGSEYYNLWRWSWWIPDVARHLIVYRSDRWSVGMEIILAWIYILIGVFNNLLVMYLGTHIQDWRTMNI